MNCVNISRFGMCKSADIFCLFTISALVFNLPANYRQVKNGMILSHFL